MKHTHLSDSLAEGSGFTKQWLMVGNTVPKRVNISRHTVHFSPFCSGRVCMSEHRRPDGWLPILISQATPQSECDIRDNAIRRHAALQSTPSTFETGKRLGVCVPLSTPTLCVANLAGP